jgi:hypothetical protein
MAKKTIYCMVDGCFDERVYVQSGLCAACYQGLLYWKNRTPTDIVHRQRQITRLGNRMELMSNVRVASRRRRA